MSTRRLFTPTPVPSSPYLYMRPRRRWWAIVGAFAAGALCVLLLIGRPHLSGTAAPTEPLHVFAHPHDAIPADTAGPAAAAKSESLRPETAMASVTHEVPP